MASPASAKRLDTETIPVLGRTVAKLSRKNRTSEIIEIRIGNAFACVCASPWESFTPCLAPFKAAALGPEIRSRCDSSLI